MCCLGVAGVSAPAFVERIGSGKDNHRLNRCRRGFDPRFDGETAIALKWQYLSLEPWPHGLQHNNHQIRGPSFANCRVTNAEPMAAVGGACNCQPHHHRPAEYWRGGFQSLKDDIRNTEARLTQEIRASEARLAEEISKRREDI